MHIVLDNEQQSKPSNQPITGRILVNLNAEFDASALTMQLQGYTRTHFTSSASGGNADQFGKTGGQVPATRLAKNEITVDYTIHNFDAPLIGQCEYRFSITLPDEVKETVLVAVGDNNMSTTYYLKAQIEPKNQTDMVDLKTKTSALRTDIALYLYRPIESEE